MLLVTQRDSVEVQLARLGGQYDMILRSLDQATEGRRHQYESIEEIRISLVSMDGRLGVVEGSLAKATPTIDEFMKIKQRVADAGAIGKWLWWVGGILVTAAFWFRSEMLTWFTRH